MNNTKKIILSSTSKARNELMNWLKIPFISLAPNVDETPLVNESIEATVERLAVAKAMVYANEFRNALIIGCDQLGEVDGKVIGKPKDHQDAVAQLKLQSDNQITFYTAIALFDTEFNTLQTAIENYTVYFKKLTNENIDGYLEKDKPYACAGSLRADGLGITLIEKFVGDDFTALIGLPLIRLTEMLKTAGYDIYL